MQVSIRLEQLANGFEDGAPNGDGSEDGVRSYRVTRERVRQIERGALEKLRNKGRVATLKDGYTDGYFQP